MLRRFPIPRHVAGKEATGTEWWASRFEYPNSWQPTQFTKVAVKDREAALVVGMVHNTSRLTTLCQACMLFVLLSIVFLS